MSTKTPIRRCVRRTADLGSGTVEFTTKSFTKKDGTEYHPIVDAETGEAFCDCPQFTFRKVNCKHIERAFENLKRHGELSAVVENLNISRGANIVRGSEYKPVRPSARELFLSRNDIQNYQEPNGWFWRALFSTAPAEEEDCYEESPALSEAEFLAQNCSIDDEIQALNFHDYEVDMLEGFEQRRAQIDSILKDKDVAFDDELVNELDELSERLEPYEIWGWPVATGNWEFPRFYFCSGDTAKGGQIFPCP